MNKPLNYVIDCLTKNQSIKIDVLFDSTDNPLAIKTYRKTPNEGLMMERDVDKRLSQACMLLFCTFLDKAFSEQKLNQLYINTEGGMGEVNAVMLYLLEENKQINLMHHWIPFNSKNQELGFDLEENIILKKHLDDAIMDISGRGDKMVKYNVLVKKRNSELKDPLKSPYITVEKIEESNKKAHKPSIYYSDGILFENTAYYAVKIDQINYKEEIERIERISNIVGIRDKIKLSSNINLEDQKTNKSILL